jgi:CheY-like chemotaxis protein
VVDDQPHLGRAIARALADRAYVCVEVKSPDALARVERGERFDLVLCDVVMPELAGPDLFERVVACAPEMREAFVFVTGGMDAALARRVTATGRPCLGKPLGSEDLRGLLRRE